MMASDALISVPSRNVTTVTIEKLRSAIQSRGMAVFATFDHAAAAREAGLSLRTTTVTTFGNPAAGTKLMQASQAVGIDLPLKILVWEDEAGIAHVSYNDPHGLVERHGLGAEVQPVIAGMSRLLASITQEAAG